uniref:Uncharacterized protein n=1 Tax=Tanacetum cinerariifolium TaxID=118510 RepID=A0A699HEB8_TANCI|nr:hypothetical protein [Tanacetum cinerariifolium]
MADKEKKSTMKGFTTNDQAYYSGITSITVNGKNGYELKRKFLDDLHKNAFSGALWDYSKLGSDEIEPVNEKTSNLEEANHDDEQEIDEIFRIETNLFDYETPLMIRFYEWNKNVPWVHEKAWTENGVWKEPSPVKHHCKPFNYKNGCSEWPTCSWRENGYCNGGNLPGAYIVGNTLCYQDLEWYDALKDSELKEEALRNKAIMEGLIIKDVESNMKVGKVRTDLKLPTVIVMNGNTRMNMKMRKDKSCGNETHELSICTVRRFEMIKYSFRLDEEYEY